jgi:hypothetical protein
MLYARTVTADKWYLGNPGNTSMDKQDPGNTGITNHPSAEKKITKRKKEAGY